MPDSADTLRSKGCKVTPQRRLIIDILRECGEHMTAEEILAQARLKQPNLSAATVYRNLNTMTNLGLIERVEIHDKGRCFELNNGQHHHHLVCIECGRAEEIGCCPISDLIKAVAKESDFEIMSHSFEITGYCRDCKGKK
ncbi:MAG: Fur family transcriptional regulator [Candidatus Saccharibacteria bacterium]